ncbi:MAG: helix-turn-helix transcriptional regulator [Oscillospiraceae bacterium]|nr:helix-turn-helix transcriptional regulator [Oscillospiraceae bacterium]
MIGKKIKERREELNLSQEQLANMLGVGKSAISNYENNISSPKETVMYKLFDALKCDANFFYEEYLNNIENFEINSIEKKHIKKYRTLDEYGKDMVDTVLEKEHKRCIEQNSNAQDESDNTGTGKMLTAKIAAFGGDNSIKQISEEELLERFRKLRG